MDVHSVEFYVIAFVVAIALFTLLMGQREHGPATTAIEQFSLTDPDEVMPDGLITIASTGLDRVRITRTRLPLTDGESAFIVATLIDSKWRLVEKRTTKSRAETTDFDATAEFNLPPGRYHIRYDSEITGQWVTFTYRHAPDRTETHQLRF